MPGNRFFRRKLNHFLKDQMHEEEQRLCLHDQHDRLLIRIVSKMLMNAAILDNHCIAGFPINPFTFMHIVTFTLEHEKDGAIHMSVLLAMTAWSKCVNM